MIVFLLEEPSMEELLNGILPQILKSEDFFTIHHDGKGDLMKSIPIKLKVWNYPGTKFVILHDQDNNNCIELKDKIKALCDPYKRNVLIRIPCKELEAWYLGDLQAVEKAYDVDLSKLKNNKKYANPDLIDDPKALIKRYVPELTQIDGARRISKYMDIYNNKSHSFNVFVDGVRRIEGLQPGAGDNNDRYG